MVQPQVTWTVELVRCVPGNDGRRAPTPEELTASALSLQDDFDAIELAITAEASSLFGAYPDVAWGTATPLGPLGVVAGWSWPFTVSRV